MATDTELVEVQEKTKIPPEHVPEENKYKIFDYFKGHTGLLVTCISALVAIMSFILNYAVGRMNYAYLEYWDIASLHANTGNQNELYTVVYALVYMLAIMLIHGLLSGTSDAFRYYNKLLSTINQVIRASKKVNRRLKRKLRSLSKQYEKLTPKQKKAPSAKNAKKTIDEHMELSEDSDNAMKQVKEMRAKISAGVGINIALAVVFSYIVGSAILALSKTTVTVTDSLRSSWTIVIIIVADLILYFVPAYFSTRCARIQYKNEDVLNKLKKLVDSDIPDFPLEDFIKNGIKTMLSDKKLKFVAVQFVALTALLLFLSSMAGTTTAETIRSFPIYKDEAATYAIVYRSDVTMFMEEAVIQDRAIVIDTTKQRIMTTDDISYDKVAFDDVHVIRIDDAEKVEQGPSLTQQAIQATGSFLKTIWVRIEEVISK